VMPLTNRGRRDVEAGNDTDGEHGLVFELRSFEFRVNDPSGRFDTNVEFLPRNFGFWR